VSSGENGAPPSADGATEAVGSTPGPASSRPVRPLLGKWGARTIVIVALCVAAFVAATVLLDLPEHSTRGGEIRTARSVIAEITRYVKPCAYAVATALRLYTKSTLPSLTGAQRTTLHSLVTTDYAACSFTDQTILTLATVREPNSPSGRVLNKLVTDTLTWCSPDAMHVIGDVSDLILSRPDWRRVGALAQSERRLDAERAAIVEAVDGLGKLLRSPLPQLELAHPDTVGTGSGSS
jgi:hypothetical protein